MDEDLFSIESDGEEKTRSVAALLAKACRPGDCILLKGDLGAGKTTFARGFIRTLYEGEEDIVSPTFTLVQNYPSKAGWPLWHFDLYRLEKTEELEHIGVDDALQSGVTLVEWPEIAAGKWPSSSLTVELAYGIDSDARRLTGKGCRETWEERLKGLA